MVFQSTHWKRVKEPAIPREGVLNKSIALIAALFACEPGIDFKNDCHRSRPYPGPHPLPELLRVREMELLKLLPLLLEQSKGRGAITF